MRVPFYAASQNRSTILALVLLPLIAWADPPNFSAGGFVMTLQYGPGFWGLDQKKLASQVGDSLAGTFVTDSQNSHTVSVEAGYNILGHATISAALTGTGWNLFDANRGGAGFLVGAVAWHPLELVFMKKERRPFGLDFSPFFGVGYGISGQTVGMDGLVFEAGLNVDYYFTRYFGLGLFARGVLLNWKSFYLDYNNRSQPGASIALTDPSGGSFWTLGLALHFRAGE
jgi:hypothetical protein